MKILIADDNHFYRCALKATLTEWGYEVVAVADGQAAWNALQGDQAPRIAILDWMMPSIDGLEVCRQLRAIPRHEPTYVIILTSREGKSNAVAALESGADDYITKPFDRGELAARLKVGRRIVSLQTSETVVYSFAQAVDGKNPYTKGHSERVCGFALMLAADLGLSELETDILRRASILHDIGKIAIPDAILNKSGPLTPEEMEIIQEHPIQGVKMIEPLASVRDTIPLVRWHHERLDGKGYPDGLYGDEIPHLVRVLSVADVYDALSSDRPYRVGLPFHVCLTILRDNAAKGGLDPDLVERFCSLPVEQLVRVGSGVVNKPNGRASDTSPRTGELVNMPRPVSPSVVAEVGG
jgi:putative two-component system response regulator